MLPERESTASQLSRDVAAVRALPLARQCQVMQLPLTQMRLPGEDRVEARVERHFEAHGCRTCHCEGGSVLVMLKAMALRTLARLNEFGFEDACSRYLEAQMVILLEHRNEILATMSTATASEVADNAAQILRGLPGEFYPNVRSDFVACLFETLGPARWTAVAEAMFEDPYEYRKGWPDLAVMDAGALRLIEVKRGDRLLASQILTIQRMRLVLGDIFEVVQVRQAPRSHGS